MIENPVLPPQYRHPFRRKLGRWFYIQKRRLEWLFSSQKFAKNMAKPFPIILTKADSPLLRPLQNVDMYLQENKVTNIRIAIECLNGLVVLPGQTFSFWKIVGKPTAKRGFLEGLTIENGKINKGTGGGLCQLGNLIFWLALHTPLSVTERWRHSYDVFPDVGRNRPFGSGATLAYNYIDLQIKNNTDEPFQLCFEIKNDPKSGKPILEGSILATEMPEFEYHVYEKEHQIRAEYWGGYSRHNTIWRKFINKKTGEVLEDSLIVENHALLMYQPFLS